MLIFLVGYMGCGKSSIGKALSKRMNMSFLDCDSEIERRSGMSVSNLFATHGENGFRELEHSVIFDATKESNTIVATGGGAPCFFGNMDLMNEAGLTIYLSMSVEKLFSRLEKGRFKRPLIRDKSDRELFDFIGQAIEKRAPYYMQSKLIIDCNAVSDEYIEGHIEHYVENHKNK